MGHATRRRTAGSLVCVVCVAIGPPSWGQQPGCRAGDGASACPVRPGQFGYYPTQWRRWPGSDRPPEQPRDGATPAPPARSLVPGPDEESPPRPTTTPATALEPSGGRTLERLVAEADAARLLDPASQQLYTDRLVVAMLTAADPRSRCIVLGLAANFQTSAAEAICTGALEDPDPRVRLMACQVCAERRGPGGAERLARRAREDTDLGVRLRAVRTLGDLGGPDAVAHLLALLDDPDPAMRTRTVAALEHATGHRFGTDVGRWKAWATNPQAQPPRWSLGGTLQGLF